MFFSRVLITGANGLLGQALLRHLSPRYDVLATGLDERSRGNPLQSYGYEALDIRRANQVRRMVDEFAPHWVINCAAVTHVDQCETDRDRCWQVNAQGVENLAIACHSIGARLIQVSTDFVFDGTSGPYDERARPCPVNFYGKAKLAGENAARRAGTDRWTVIRTNVLYGKSVRRQRDDFVGWAIRQLRAGLPIDAFVDQWRTPTYADELAWAIERVVHFGRTGVYNVSGREFLSMYEFARTVAQAFDLDESKVRPVTGPTQVAKRPKRTGLLILKAETELDFRPRTMEAALADLRLRLEDDA